MCKESELPILELSNGLAWCLVSDETLTDLSNNLAVLLGLKRGCHRGSARIILTLMDGRKRTSPPLAPHFAKGVDYRVPDDGWRLHDRRSVRCWSHATIPDIICEISGNSAAGPDFLSGEPIVMALYDKAVEAGCIPLHAGLCELDGKGVLLVGRSGTGKTTCCRRIPAPWRALCDDEVLVAPHSGAVYGAHPFPTWSDLAWGRSDRTWDVASCSMVSAIFFLEKAETESSVRLGQAEAAMRLLSSAAEVLMVGKWDLDSQDFKSTRARVFSSACALAQHVPGYILRTTRHGRFWMELEKHVSNG